jgi:hypothetical protein
MEPAHRKLVSKDLAGNCDCFRNYLAFIRVRLPVAGRIHRVSTAGGRELNLPSPSSASDH